MKDMLIFIMSAVSHAGISAKAIATCLCRRRTKKKADTDKNAIVSG
jgi:hypothetical protein